MPTYITNEGLQIPTVTDLLETLAEDNKTNVDPLIETEADSLAGNANGVFASSLREAWEALRVGFDSVNPFNAEGERLDVVGAIRGTPREVAKYSTLSGTKRVTVTLADGAIVTAGVTMFSVDGKPDTRFVATETVENTTGVEDDFQVAARAEFTGPVVANAGTLTVVATPTTGINAVTNAFDATIGADVEKDEPYRQRQERELKVNGGSTADAITADLLALEDENEINPILAVQILENLTDTVDALGLPPHSFEAIVWDGVGQEAEDADVWEVIKANRPLGTKSYGAEVSTTGKEAFTRPTQINIHIIVTLKKDPTTYVGDAAVKALLALTGAAEQKPSIGGDTGVVAFSDYLASAWSAGGVTRVTSVQLDPTGTFSFITNQDGTIPARSIAVVDTSNIVVLATDEV